MGVQEIETERLDLAIEGMTCSACSARLERVLSGAAGISEATVNLALERAIMNIDPNQTDLDSVMGTVRRCGFNVGTETSNFHVEGLGDSYVADQVEDALHNIPGVLAVEVNPAFESVRVTAVSLMVPDAALVEGVRAAGYQPIFESGDKTKREHRQTRRERWEIAIAVILTAPFMVHMGGMYSEAHYLHLPPWVQLVLVIPIQFILGMRFYRGAVNALRGGGANMDVLVAMGTTAAFVYSVYQMAAQMMGLSFEALGVVLQAHMMDLYFEASAVIITLVLVGKHIEARAKRGASAAIQELLALKPDTTLVRLPNGEMEERACEELKVGDVVVCRPGDQVAVDGIIVRGDAEIDESLITGESNPVAKVTGDLVTAGSFNTSGFIDIETRVLGEDSTLAKIIRLIENAQITKPTVQRLVDRISAIFVPVVVSISAVTFAGWWFASGDVGDAIINAVSVLVIACPCALGLATPTAIMTGSGAAARAGILIKDIVTLEHAHNLSHVVFDKTGTLTEGKPVIAEIELLAGLNENKVLQVAATLQQGSEHPIAQAFRTSAEDRDLVLLPVDHFKSTVARGVEGYIEGVCYLVGNDRLFREKGLEPPPRELSRGGAEVWLGASMEGGEVLLARFEIVDELRPKAKAAIEQLEQLGVVPLLASGDAVSVAERIAKALGIAEVYGKVLPEDKAVIIKKLIDQGAHVGMVGDGINDAPALAQATVGIAMSSGTDVAMETAAITLMRPDPRLVAGAIDASRKTFRKIKQNLFWAFLYNVIGLPLAAFGILTPSLAGAAMAFSSVSVVTNSLLLRTWKPKLKED